MGAAYRIFTDSTADLDAEMEQRLDVTVVPTDFMIDGDTYSEYPDAREMKSEKFYELMRGGTMPKTAVINPARFEEYFDTVLKEGLDILYIVFSSGLSVTLQNAMLAADEMREKYPERTITIVDSLSVSLGEALLVMRAAAMRDEGKTAAQIAQWVEETRLHVCHWFTVDDLGHLRRGGRISAAAAVVGGMLNIKPVMHVNDEGKLEPVSKARGRRAAIAYILDRMEQYGTDLSEQSVMIVHADCRDDAEETAQEIKKRFHVKEVVIGVVGAVIGSHAGPGTLAVFYLGSER